MLNYTDIQEHVRPDGVIVLTRGSRIALLQDSEHEGWTNVYVGTQAGSSAAPGDEIIPARWFERLTNCSKRFKTAKIARMKAEKYLLHDGDAARLIPIERAVFRFREAVRDLLCIYGKDDVIKVLLNDDLFMLLPIEYAGNEAVKELLSRIEAQVFYGVEAMAYLVRNEVVGRDRASRYLDRLVVSRYCTKNHAAASDEEKRTWRHIDAAFESVVNEDHGDERWRCPHCGYAWVKEGPDS